MILDFKHYRERGPAKTLSILARAVFDQVFGPLLYRRVMPGSVEAMAPRLKQDEKGNTFCISCGLCESFCPTRAIRIKIDQSIQMPKDLQVGPAPMEFGINDELCVRCNLCVEICPVDALISADY